MPFTYEYPAHYVTVDPVIFGVDSTRASCDLQILLIARGDPKGPFFGCWALPGGFVEPGESLDVAAARELEEETGVTGAFLEQLYTFGEPGRDPRGRVITSAYYALVKRASCTVRAGSDAAEARWFPVSGLSSIVFAFDHAVIVAMAVARLRAKVRYQPIGFQLLPERFPIAQLHALYEAILGRELDRHNFRRVILRMGLLKEAGKERSVPHRAATLYRFDSARYAQLVKRGFNFEI